jgi:oligopeptide transport system permease protein
VLQYFLKRLGGAIPTLFIIITGSFFMIRMAPGGPFDRERVVPPDIMANLMKAYHLDEPLWQQYLRYLAALAHGDFGPSFKYKDFSVAQLIAQGFPTSLSLGAIAMAAALIIGLSLGVWAALRQNTMVDYSATGVSMLGIAVPNFVVAPMLTLVFGLMLGWLPVGGWGSPANYVLPVVSYLGPAIAQIITGSVVVEQIFSIPGIGRYFVQSSLNRDYTMVMGVTVFYGALVIFCNLVADLLYGVLDPKVRYD